MTMTISSSVLDKVGKMADEYGMDRYSLLACVLCYLHGFVPDELMTYHMVAKELCLKEVLTLETLVDKEGVNKNGKYTEEFVQFVDEYTNLFRIVRPDMPRHTRDCLARLSKYMKQFGYATQERILEATKRYLSKTEPKFVMQPHYFIVKGSGSAATSSLDAYVEEVIRGE